MKKEKTKNNNTSLETLDTKNKEKEYIPLVKRSKRRNDLLSNKETSIIKKQSRKIIKWIAIIGIIVMSIIVVSCTIDIFDFFYKINKYAGYASLIIIILLLLIFVIRPIVTALSTPCFTLDVIENGDKKNISRKQL